MKQILVTGGCGFIGSNLIRLALRERPDWSITNVDALTYAADPTSLDDVADDEGYSFRKIDIRDRDALSRLFNEIEPDGVLHLAAETHVDNSISAPDDFITTNLVGTANLLAESRSIADAKPIRFLHVSTDEVYGSLGPEGAFSEGDPYRPNSPYSASKAGSDHLVRAWYVTYGLDVVTTNCANNFGPFQHREKLIPTVIATALAGEPIPVYGDGRNVREWLYVDDHARGIIDVFEKGAAGETYLIGARHERENIDLVREICGILDEEVGDGPDGGYSSLITFVTDRAGHDRRYAVDPSKIESELGWSPTATFDEALRSTIRWYVDRLASEKQ